MSPTDKPLVWLHGEVKSPPFGTVARTEAGVWLRRVQRGEHLVFPQSRPMPNIGPNVHELRVPDQGVDWRIVYRIDRDAVLIVDVFRKTTQRTPQHVSDACKRRLRQYDNPGERGR